MQTMSKQTRASARVGHQNCYPPLPHQPEVSSSCPTPFSTAYSQLHTIDCEVHPGAIGRIIFGAVLVQEEHPALVPALVFCSEPFNLKRCPLLQPDSP